MPMQAIEQPIILKRKTTHNATNINKRWHLVLETRSKFMDILASGSHCKMFFVRTSLVMGTERVNYIKTKCD